MRKGQLTSQRKLIYEMIKKDDTHPTAADIIDRLNKEGISMAYATVYNSLRYLKDARLIRELQLEGSSSRYDARVEEHQHILCTACGKVDEVFAASPQDFIRDIEAKTGYIIHEEQLIFKGVCESCQQLKPSVH